MIVDGHVHVNPFWLARDAFAESYRSFRDDYDRLVDFARDPALFVEYLDEQGVDAAVIVYYVDDCVTDYAFEINEFAADYRDAAPDRLRVFGSPNFTADADVVNEQLDRIFGDLDLDGIKVHPPHQDVPANAYRDPPHGNGNEALAATYERAAEADVPVMVHTGTSIFPGARNVNADPIAIDDVLVDFDATVVLAHGGRPIYADETAALLYRHDDLYLDVSSMPPGYALKQYPQIEDIADRVIFGTDWPGPGVPDLHENVDAFRESGLSDDALADVLGGTAARLFDL